jgi:pimeloyl-ACP methyl ester carboxylesterase
VEHIEINGVSVAYARAGVGPPVVLLHGGFGFDSRSWRRQLDALTDEVTAIAWDMPGSGQSGDPPETWSAADYAHTLAAFIGALGLDHPHVLGLSFGSALALELYRWHPEIPQSLILASAYAGWAGSLSPDEVAQRKDKVMRALDLPPQEWARIWAPSMLAPSAPSALVDEVEKALATFHPTGQRAMLHAFADQDLRDVLPQVAVPTLLLYGERDARSPVRVGEELHARIPGSRLVVVPDVGHMINLEAPRRFDDEVRQFIRSLR